MIFLSGSLPGRCYTKRSAEHEMIDQHGSIPQGEPGRPRAASGTLLMSRQHPDAHPGEADLQLEKEGGAVSEGEGQQGIGFLRRRGQDGQASRMHPAASPHTQKKARVTVRHPRQATYARWLSPSRRKRFRPPFPYTAMRSVLRRARLSGSRTCPEATVVGELVPWTALPLRSGYSLYCHTIRLFHCHIFSRFLHR